MGIGCAWDSSVTGGTRSPEPSGFYCRQDEGAGGFAALAPCGSCVDPRLPPACAMSARSRAADRWPGEFSGRAAGESTARGRQAERLALRIGDQPLREGLAAEQRRAGRDRQRQHAHAGDTSCRRQQHDDAPTYSVEPPSGWSDGGAEQERRRGTATRVAHGQREAALPARARPGRRSAARRHRYRRDRRRTVPKGVACTVASASTTAPCRAGRRRRGTARWCPGWRTDPERSCPGQG